MTKVDERLGESKASVDESNERIKTTESLVAQLVKAYEESKLVSAMSVERAEVSIRKAILTDVADDEEDLDCHSQDVEGNIIN